jgi:hypothetical protein
MTHRRISAWLMSHESVKRGAVCHLLVLAALVFCAVSGPAAAQGKDKKKEPSVAIPEACQRGEPARHFTVDITGALPDVDTTVLSAFGLSRGSYLVKKASGNVGTT